MTLLNLDPSFAQHDFEDLLNRLNAAEDRDESMRLMVELKNFARDHFECLHQFKHALEQSDTTITVTDNRGRITYVDDNFCEMTGFTADEILGNTHRLINSGYHPDSFFRELWLTILEGKVWRGEVKNRHKNGSVIWMQTIIIPLFERAGSPGSFIAFRKDISREKEMEQQLIKTMEDEFERTFDALINMIYKVQKREEDGRFFHTMIKGRLAKTLGLPTELGEGIYLEDFLQLEQAERFKEKYKHAFLGEEVNFKMEFNELYLYFTLAPIRENGEVVEVVGSAVDITSLEEAEQQVRHLAYHDQLTGLPNRSKLAEDLDVWIAQDNGPFVIFYCDLDRLKYINDAMGQFAGDQVISTIAKRIEDVTWGQGNLYRYGGDEFIFVLQDDCTDEAMEQIGNVILKQINKPLIIAGKEFFITCSIGISRFGSHGKTSEQLINHAGIAMHYCKVNGRNGKLVYSKEMNQTYNDLILLEGELRRALTKEELTLYYQPKIDVNSGEIIGMEALTRWFHPERGFISPQRFITLAEETGLIIQLGEWVIKEACRQQKQWKEAGFKMQRVAINVSALEIQRKDFTAKVRNILKETGVPPQCLELEITENSVMQNTEECIETMNELREMGITLSIDDFGTGYSSFGYLRKFPINHLKIDQSFIRDAFHEPSNAEIVKAMIQLAHTFGVKVVAEGVEERAALDFLKHQNCDYYQGYYFSRPVPAEEFENMLVAEEV
ncbi:putative bifunctional diguanylate cyclase/phosphodiesterase [Sediminibacillus halophilus]|uniref:PAS domain S-box-containing protein/diguanylate cyclase (GGDEF) domain-containing protein n=1 Tax=Sediminibacillus halophilus TaxID=482461 RepID=A0A1G9VCS6_9BACI|nr:EAL domain-containing protein [Sediminibacillus halophilus]SDM70002.1 PAS domain S-box-containing protein/diguanylate cyclase (GGDEF) domain-containing protein [Sediminibacillus halophilus]